MELFCITDASAGVDSLLIFFLQTFIWFVCSTHSWCHYIAGCCSALYILPTTLFFVLLFNCYWCWVCSWAIDSVVIYHTCLMVVCILRCCYTTLLMRVTPTNLLELFIAIYSGGDYLGGLLGHLFPFSEPQFPLPHCYCLLLHLHFVLELLGWRPFVITHLLEYCWVTLFNCCWFIPSVRCAFYGEPPIVDVSFLTDWTFLVDLYWWPLLLILTCAEWYVPVGLLFLWVTHWWHWLTCTIFILLGVLDGGAVSYLFHYWWLTGSIPSEEAWCDACSVVSIIIPFTIHCYGNSIPSFVIWYRWYRYFGRWRWSDLLLQCNLFLLPPLLLFYHIVIPDICCSIAVHFVHWVWSYSVLTLVPLFIWYSFVLHWVEFYEFHLFTVPIYSLKKIRGWCLLAVEAGSTCICDLLRRGAFMPSAVANIPFSFLLLEAMCYLHSQHYIPLVCADWLAILTLLLSVDLIHYWYSIILLFLLLLCPSVVSGGGGLPSCLIFYIVPFYYSISLFPATGWFSPGDLMQWVIHCPTLVMEAGEYPLLTLTTAATHLLMPGGIRNRCAWVENSSGIV